MLACFTLQWADFPQFSHLSPFNRICTAQQSLGLPSRSHDVRKIHGRHGMSCAHCTVLWRERYLMFDKILPTRWKRAPYSRNTTFVPSSKWHLLALALSELHSPIRTASMIWIGYRIRIDGFGKAVRSHCLWSLWRISVHGMSAPRILHGKWHSPILCTWWWTKIDTTVLIVLFLVNL